MLRYDEHYCSNYTHCRFCCYMFARTVHTDPAAVCNAKKMHKQDAAAIAYCRRNGAVYLERNVYCRTSMSSGRLSGNIICCSDTHFKTKGRTRYETSPRVLIMHVSAFYWSQHIVWGVMYMQYRNNNMWFRQFFDLSVSHVTTSKIDWWQRPSRCKHVLVNKSVDRPSNHSLPRGHRKSNLQRQLCIIFSLLTTRVIV